ncbi:MAG TPA: acetate--CoA ligase [Candidatus Tectomicrobia bacterium]|jgi:acetyl-CoA synthetase
MGEESRLESLSRAEEVIVPPVALRHAAFLQNLEETYRRSIADNEAFWAGAAEELVWFRKWDRVFEWTYPRFRWFVGAQCNITMNALDRHVNSWRKNKVAFVWVGEDGSEVTVSYGQLLRRVNRVANGLKSLGVRKGDRVVLYMPLTMEGVTAMLACARIGAIHSVVYAGFSAGALRTRIEDAHAKVVLTADVTYRRGRAVDLKAITDEAVGGLDFVEKVVVHRRQTPPCELRAEREIDFYALVGEQSVECEPEVMDAEEPLYILYTSGTTGKPKGVLHVHGGYMVGTYYHLKAFWDLRDEDVFLCTSDIGWVVGHSYIVYAPLVAGATTVFREGAPDYPNPGVIWSIVERHGVSVMFTAPTAIRMFMRFGPEYPQKYNLQSLRFLTCAGEPLNPEAWRWAHQHLVGNGAWGYVADNWWQTETGGPCLGTPICLDSRPGKVGQPLPGVIADVVDLHGHPVEPGHGGLLVLKRPFPHLFRTVYGDPERYERDWGRIPGCYFTGDVAIKDADGYFMVVGRADDVMNVAGHRIGTAEVESSLVSHPAVAEAAVIGKPDPIKGEAIKAFVTLRVGHTASPGMVQILQNHVRHDLGPIAQPGEIDFVERLPKTRSGKIMRRLLKANELGVDPGDITTLED